MYDGIFKDKSFKAESSKPKVSKPKAELLNFSYLVADWAQKNLWAIFFDFIM